MYHVGLLQTFFDYETQHSQHAWAMLDAKESLRTHCEIHFFLDEADPSEGIVNKLAKEPGAGGKEEGGDLIQILNGIVEKATCRGNEKMEAQRIRKLAIRLQGGAGQAHKAANVDKNALPPLRLIIEPEHGLQNSEFISDPLKVAEHHAKPWKAVWKASDADFENYVGKGF